MEVGTSNTETSVTRHKPIVTIVAMFGIDNFEFPAFGLIEGNSAHLHHTIARLWQLGWSLVQIYSEECLPVYDSRGEWTERHSPWNQVETMTGILTLCWDMTHISHLDTTRLNTFPVVPEPYNQLEFPFGITTFRRLSVRWAGGTGMK